MQTFVLNKQWTFHFHGGGWPVLFRYLTVYALGYVINFISLMLLVEQLRMPHEIVQGVMILFISVLLFLAQRHWVFTGYSKSTNT
jgi:putative flippase GtrA